MKRQKLYPEKGKLSGNDGNTATGYEKAISKEQLEDYGINRWLGAITLLVIP